MGSGSSTQGSSGWSGSQKRNLPEILQGPSALGDLLFVSLLISIGLAIFVCYFKCMWVQGRAIRFEGDRKYRDIESHGSLEDKEEVSES